MIDGQVRAERPVPEDLGDRIERARAVLRAVGEDLVAADLVLTGPVVQHRVHPREQARAEVDDLGPVTLSVGDVLA